MNHPKVLTIVVPTYNMELYLERCLSSLVLSDHNLMSATEVLVVIDGATDKSLEIAQRYNVQYPNVFRVIEKENGNYGSCVNRGLLEAKGKYFCVLDADDCFDTEVYAQYLKKLQSLNVDLVINSGLNVYDEGNSSWRWDFSYEEDVVYSIEELGVVWIHEVTHRTECLRQCHYRQTEGISYSDEELVFYPMFVEKNFCALDLPLYRYTVGREGQTIDHSNWLKSVDHDIIVAKRMFAHLNSFDWKNTSARNYIEKKTLGRVRGFYWRSLIKCNAYNDSRIVEFDKYLETSCPDYFKDTDNLETPSGRFKFKYVHYWRKNNRHLNSKWNRFRLYQYWLRLRSFK